MGSGTFTLSSKKSLDREQQKEYELQIKAISKNGQQAVLTLTVTVADLEDSLILDGGLKKLVVLLVQGLFAFIVCLILSDLLFYFI